MPAKGGDGAKPADPPRPDRNTTVRPAGATCNSGARGPEIEFVPTSDPDDWAHDVKDPSDIERRVLAGSTLADVMHGERPGRPREYPASQLVPSRGGPVSIDSAFDAAAAAGARLQAQGIEVGWATLSVEDGRRLSRACALACGLRPRARAERIDDDPYETPRTRKLEQAAKKLLRLHKVRHENGL